MLTNDSCGMIGDHGRGPHFSGRVLETRELSMIIGALVLLALAQTPDISATLSGQVVDQKAGLRPMSTCCSRRWEARPGNDRCSRG